MLVLSTLLLFFSENVSYFSFFNFSQFRTKNGASINNAQGRARSFRMTGQYSTLIGREWWCVIMRHIDEWEKENWFICRLEKNWMKMQSVVIICCQLWFLIGIVNNWSVRLIEGLFLGDFGFRELLHNYSKYYRVYNFLHDL